MDRFCCSSEVSSESSFCSQSSHLLPSSWRGRWLRLTHLSEKWTLTTANHLNLFVPKWSQQNKQNHNLGLGFCKVGVSLSLQTGPRVNDCVSPLPKVLVVFSVEAPMPDGLHSTLHVTCCVLEAGKKARVWSFRVHDLHIGTPFEELGRFLMRQKHIIDPFKSEGDGNHPFLEQVYLNLSSKLPHVFVCFRWVNIFCCTALLSSNSDPWYGLSIETRTGFDMLRLWLNRLHCARPITGFKSSLELLKTLSCLWLTWPSSSSQTPRSWSGHHHQRQPHGSSHPPLHPWASHQGWSWRGATQQHWWSHCHRDRTPWRLQSTLLRYRYPSSCGPSETRTLGNQWFHCHLHPPERQNSVCERVLYGTWVSLFVVPYRALQCLWHIRMIHKSEIYTKLQLAVTAFMIAGSYYGFGRLAIEPLSRQKSASHKDISYKDVFINPASLIMSWSSASVGFWPKDRITVPNSFVVMVPSPSLSNKEKGLLELCDLFLSQLICHGARGLGITRLSSQQAHLEPG